MAPPRRDRNKRVREIRELEPHLRKATPKVRELTVADLEDLETRFKGEDPGNPKVAELTLEDLQSLEESFQGLRQEAAQRAQREGLPGPTPEEPEDWSISCCSCTPCCCCAAAEVDPFAA